MITYMYFERAVLNKYRTNSHLYILDEDDMGGELKVTSIWDENNKNEYPYFDLIFAFRKLTDNTVCVAIPRIFFERKVAKSEQNKWLAFEIVNPNFQEIDTSFTRWNNTYLEGSWEEEDGPKKQIETQISLINAISTMVFNIPFFKYEKFSQINYPAAQNSEEYTKSINDLYRLIIDSMEKNAIIKLAAHLKIKLSYEKEREKGFKKLNSFKEILPEKYIDLIHKPIKDISQKRNKMHGIPSEGIVSYSAFDSFESDLRKVSEAFSLLKKWFEEITNLNAESCMNRLESLSLFPLLDEKYCHEGTRKSAKMMEGKRINKVEYGATKKNESSHRSEAINIYFDDGTAITIRIGSNASEIAYKYDDLKISDIHTDIMLFWADKLKSNEKK